ncbi:MAG: fasciclin domain-containing protein, partial [Flavobacteriia bacterium]
MSHAQTNVYDNVLLVSPNHSTFATALQQTGLEVMLQDVTGTYTVFAPDNNAFINLSLKLGITVNDVLNLPELPDILEYHIANSVLQTTNLANGLLLNVVNPTNTVKVSTTSLGTFFVNHATINNPDLLSDNGVVHSIDEIIFPEITVFD